MRQTIDPRFEFDRGPVLWGAAVTALCGAVVLFVLQRPDWLLPTGVVGGAAAAARSGFYEQSSTNGFVGVLLGVVFLFPAVLLYRAVVLPTVANTGDALFLTVTLSLVDIIVYGPLMLILGYVGGTLVDIVRRRTDGRLGY